MDGCMDGWMDGGLMLNAGFTRWFDMFIVCPFG